MEFTVSSRPGEKKSEFEVSSRPKVQQPGASLFEHYMRLMGESADSMKQGYGQMTAPGASLGSRAMGAGQAALGGLGYVASPFSAAMRRVIGNPAEVVAGAAGASPETQTQVGDIAGIAGEILGPAGLPKAIQSAPAIARSLPDAMPAINRGATAVGQVGRGAINTVEDLIRSGMEGAQRRAATRAADVAPTAQQVGNMAQEVNQAATAAGMNVRPEAFAAFADNVPNVLQTARITSGEIPISNRLYPETIALRDRLEAYRGHPLTLDNLHTLQQEANGFVREALKAAEGNRSANDFRGATILARQIRDFVSNITPDMVTSGNPQQAAELLNRAKELWRREAKMNTIQDIVNVARDLRDPKYLQSGFKSLVKDDVAMRDFTAQEAALIRDIAAGSRLAEIADAVPGLAQAKNVVQKVDKAARGANAGGRVDAAQELLDMIARGEADQQARAAQRAAQPSFGQRIEETLRPPVNNTQTRRGGAQRNPNVGGSQGSPEGIMQGLREGVKHTFSGTLNVTHGSPQKGLQRFRDPAKVDPGRRYDGGGKGSAAYGHHTYFDEKGNWTNGSMDRGINAKGGVYDVGLNFQKAFVLTPESISDARRIAGIAPDAPPVSGEQLAQALKDKGYDGLIVRGFDDWKPIASGKAKKLRDDEYKKLVEEGYDWNQDRIGSPMEEWEKGNYEMLARGLTPDAGQDQIVSFYPHKNAQIKGKRKK